jgi:YMGG-like Gly-zipper
MLEEHFRSGWGSGIGVGGVLDTMGVFRMPLTMDIRRHMAMATRLMGTHPMDTRPRTVIRRSQRHRPHPRRWFSSNRKSPSLRRQAPQRIIGTTAESRTVTIRMSGIARKAGCKLSLNPLNSKKAMAQKPFRLFPLIAIFPLAACVSMPTGPSMLALPGNGRSFDEFRLDDQTCRQFAQEQAGGTPGQASASSGVKSAVLATGIGAATGAAFGALAGPEGAATGAAIGAATGLLAGTMAGANAAGMSGSIVQRRYDMGYIQCMYANGHRVPVSGPVQYSPDSQAASYRFSPPPPPPTKGARPQALPPGVPPPPPGVPPPPPPP